MQHGLLAGTDDYNRGFRRIVIALVSLIVLPTALLLAVGIVMLVFYDLRANLVFGMLVVALVVCLLIGAVLALIFLRREANLSRLQLDFVSKVSHELRTPLTSIRMFAETLRYEHDRQKVDTCLDILQAETERLSERIERLLDWGRMEAGRRRYDLRPDHVEPIVAEAITHFRAATMGQERELQVDIEANLPSVPADRSALCDALVNLLTNAHKYSPKEQPIEIRAFQNRGAVLIEVADRGPGIARKEQRRIFEKFYRSDDRLSRSVEGSGLGLSIVKHAMHAHEGKVKLRNAVGGGSVFTLVLPLEGIAVTKSPSSMPPRSDTESGRPAQSQDVSRARLETKRVE